MFPLDEVLLLAVAIDLVFGEPPAAFHPTVWMGRLIFWLTKPRGRFYGVFVSFVVVGGAALLGIAVSVSASGFAGQSSVLQGFVMAYFLKTSFSIRMLLTQPLKIAGELESGRLEEARRSLSRLVSRDTRRLSPAQTASAAIETTSENLVDSLVSPLFYYMLLGLPGALAYRAVNTLDAMVGYKTEPYRQIGWASARLDDLANFLPARISVILIALATLKGKGVKTALREHSKTPSPNSGWPMAATAGVLEVTLEKQGYYKIGDGPYPGPEDVRKTVKLIAAASLIAVLIAAAATAHLHQKLEALPFIFELIT